MFDKLLSSEWILNIYGFVKNFIYNYEFLVVFAVLYLILRVFAAFLFAMFRDSVPFDYFRWRSGLHDEKTVLKKMRAAGRYKFIVLLCMLATLIFYIYCMNNTFGFGFSSVGGFFLTLFKIWLGWVLIKPYVDIRSSIDRDLMFAYDERCNPYYKKP